MDEDEQLHIEVEDGGDHLICRPIGELDVITVGRFRDTVATLAGRRDLIIDFSFVGFSDSAGLGAVIGAIRRIHEAGDVVALACGDPRLLQLGFARLERLAPVRETVAAAAAALLRAPSEIDVSVYVETTRAGVALEVARDVNRRAGLRAAQRRRPRAPHRTT